MVNSIQSENVLCVLWVSFQVKTCPLCCFPFFVNDLEQFFILNGNSSLKLDPDLCTQYLQLFVLMYADDTVLLANTNEGLRKGLSDLQKYCDLWDIKVNEQKQKLLSLTKDEQGKCEHCPFFYKNT